MCRFLKVTLILRLFPLRTEDLMERGIYLGAIEVYRGLTSTLSKAQVSGKPHKSSQPDMQQIPHKA